MRIFDFAATFASLREIGVAEDREKPSFEVRTFFKARKIAPCFDERILDEVIGARWVSAKRVREGTQVGDRADQQGLQLVVTGCSRRFSCWRSWLKRSGTGSLTSSL